jgi:RecA-family ATPase
MAKPLRDLLASPVVGVPSYIGNGVLPKRGRMIIGGQPAIGKSMLVLNLAYDLASGRPLFGFTYHDKSRPGQAVLPVHEPVRVLYVEQEIGEFALQERFALLHEARKDDVALDNIWWHTMDWDLQLDRKQASDQWNNLILSAAPNVVIIDPYSQFHTSDENDSGDMGLVLTNLNKLMVAHDISIVVVHHFGKPGETSRYGMHRFRGSSAITAWADTRLTLDHDRREWGKLSMVWTIRRGKPVMDMVVKVNKDTLEAEPVSLSTTHTVNI